jgi:uncharacterized protein (DUF58 family)
MLPKEVIKKIRALQIKTARVVNDVFAGQYESVFKGRGIEFEEVREYQPGDEIKTIDWNVTARTGYPHVKVFVEERELTVLLLVDLSASEEFGSANRLKNEIASELCSVLAFSAITNNDKVGLLVFTDEEEKFIPPDKGKKHVLRVIREVMYCKPKSKGTDINKALEYLNKVMKKKAIVFVISDFYAENYQKLLRITNKHHDVIGLLLSDLRELNFPPIGFIELEDAETGKKIVINSNDYAYIKKFKTKALERLKRIKKDFYGMGVDLVNISIDKSYLKPLIQFFKMREARR